MIARMDFLKRLTPWPARLDWDAIYTAELPRVYNYFRYLGLEDTLAEDLTASTFEKAWRSRETYQRERAGAATWLLRIARNTAVDYFRARSPELGLEAAEAVPAGPDPEECLLESEQSNRLRCLLAALPPRERELMALKYGAGLNNRQIASETGLSESNVGTILHRVIRELREQWEQKP
jgi:RNA polymerase sigma-70 factor, ECF subfamily